MKQWATNLQENSLNGIDNVSIAHASMQQGSDSPAIILVNGRSESYLKYQDIANHFFDQGFSVYMLDHRGQGISQRLLANHEKGHVIDFNHYIEDLATFIDDVVVPNKHSNLFILGHSMGGAIVTRYLQTKAHRIDRVILASPMFGVLLPAPKPIIKLLAKGIVLTEQCLSTEPSYVLGGNRYEEKPFHGNELTNDLNRYEGFCEIYRQYPKIQLGSPTNVWLLQALKACEECIEQASEITIPILLLQAGSDTIVDNRSQDDFGEALNSKLLSFIRMDDARHEILFESDSIRQPAFEAIEKFLEYQC